MLLPLGLFPTQYPVLIAVSGGVDSMVLLFAALQKIDPANIVVAHFHHSIRGLDADKDMLLVQDACKHHGIAFFTEKQDIPALAKSEKLSIESAARKYRYQFFARICKQENITSLLTAHHLGDRIETALFNLIRGTKFPGILALKRQDTLQISGVSIQIFRPLFSCTKTQIETFAKKHAIDFREDTTNQDDTIQRNHIRHNILPHFSTINPSYERSIEQFLDYVEIVAADQETQIQAWITQYTKNNTFLQQDFSILSLLHKKQLLTSLYQQANTGTIGLSEGMIAEMIRFIEGTHSFGSKNFRNLYLERRGKKIFYTVNTRTQEE